MFDEKIGIKFLELYKADSDHGTLPNIFIDISH
jgi:hypothetical protein